MSQKTWWGSITSSGQGMRSDRREFRKHTCLTRLVLLSLTIKWDDTWLVHVNV